MAWLVLPDGTGTLRLYHPAMAGYYDEKQEVVTRDVDGVARRVLHLQEPVADRLVDEGVGERVLAEDYFDASDDADDDPDTPPDGSDGTEGGDDEDEPPDGSETADADEGSDDDAQTTAEE